MCSAGHVFWALLAKNRTAASPEADLMSVDLTGLSRVTLPGLSPLGPDLMGFRIG